MRPVRIGIIGGSGLVRMEGLTDTREQVVDTPFGAPSDALLLGKLAGVDVAFLARHGRSHALIPGQIPFRANIYAMKALGVQARLAREAEMAYATLALATDRGCWHPHQACVTAEMAIANLQGNAERAQTGERLQALIARFL